MFRCKCRTVRFHGRHFLRRTLTQNSTPTNFPFSATSPSANRLVRFEHQRNFASEMPLTDGHHPTISRYLSDANSPSSSPRQLVHSGEDVRRELTIVFENVVCDIVETARKADPDLAERYGKFLRYMVSGGKKNRSTLVMESYRHLTRHSAPSERSLKLAYVMACCVEMVNIHVCLVDDLADDRPFRHGKPCWHRLEGETAKNDASMLQNGIYSTLRKNFCDEPYYSVILERFHEAVMIHALGRCWNMLIIRKFFDTRKLELFTMDEYQTIVKHENTDNTFHFPMTMAMRMAGITDEKISQQTEDIFNRMGVLLASQDNYSNCYGDANSTGKEGDDIAAGKCTWLIVTAVERANAQQRAILHECYGRPNADKVEAVKRVYEELGLPKLFAEHENETRNYLHSRIKSLPENYPREALFSFLDFARIRATVR